MRRMLGAGLLALPLVLSAGTAAKAQGCATGNCPSGMSAGLFGWGGPHRGSPWNCGAICMKFFGAIHQEGPLFNYGPYTGYYPFEPYGPWTADLRYNGPRDGACGACGRFGCGGRCGGLGDRLGGLFHRDGCGRGGCGYATSTFHNVCARLHLKKGCKGGGCGEVVAASSSCDGCIHER